MCDAPIACQRKAKIRLRIELEINRGYSMLGVPTNMKGLAFRWGTGEGRYVI